MPCWRISAPDCDAGLAWTSAARGFRAAQPAIVRYVNQQAGRMIAHFPSCRNLAKTTTAASKHHLQRCVAAPGQWLITASGPGRQGTFADLKTAPAHKKNPLRALHLDQPSAAAATPAPVQQFFNIQISSRTTALSTNSFFAKRRSAGSWRARHCSSTRFDSTMGRESSAYEMLEI